MIFITQLQNLLYSMVFTSIDHLHHFVPLFLMGLGVFLFFSLISLGLFKQKTFLHFFLTFYTLIAVWVVAVDILARLGGLYSVAIAVVTLLLVLFVLVRSSTVFSTIKNLKSLISKRTLWTVVLVVGLTFFFSKFIYNNGLHDEYQHHAVVEDMIKTEKWPIRDEFRYGIELSSIYHYGWYYLVILVKSIFFVSIETALDLTKIALFIPSTPFLTVLIKKYLQRTWMQSTALSVLLVFQGPALFFLDAYTGNVFFSQGNEIVYEPLFFQLAGITWFGLVFMVAFLVTLHQLFRNSKHWQSVFYLLFSAWSLLLLNKAYFLIFVPAVILLGVYVYQTELLSIFKKKKRTFALLFFVSVAAFALLYLSIRQLSPLLYQLLKGESGIPFVRTAQRWGFPFSSQSGLGFQPVFSLDALKSFGVIPLLSLGILIKKIILEKKKSTTVLVTLFWFFLWLSPVLINFSRSELALNKFYIPAMWLSTLVVVQFALSQSKKVQLLFWGVIFTSVLAPTVYFASISIPNSQQYWKYSDPITEYLSKEDGITVVAIDDFEYGKYLMNTLDVQLVSVRAKNIDIGEVAEYEVTNQRKNAEKPVAETESHYLYTK